MVKIQHPLRLAACCLAAFLMLLLWAGCSGGGGGGVNPVSVTLTATPEIVQSGQGVALHWESQNATTVTSSNFGASAVNGTKQVTPAAVTTYTITVSNGERTASANVKVTPLNMPPVPVQGATVNDPFFVGSENYFYLYGSTQHADAPFTSNYLFADGHYPAGFSYQTVTDPPSGFVLSTECENSITLWAQADPRVCMISGVTPTTARVKVSLTESISYGGVSNIIGLTKAVPNANGPCFEVSVATIDPYDSQMMSMMEIQRTLTHELGHVLGLGHTPDIRDVMYYQSNGAQGFTPARFLTFGDARAIWSTLTARLVNWHPERPTVTPGGAGMVLLDRSQRHAYITDEGGVVICVYPR